MQKIDDCKEIRLALTRAGIATRSEKCLQTFRLVVTVQYIYHMRHVKELNSRLKLAYTMDFSLRFAKPPVDQIPELVAFSDTSHYRDRVEDSRIGMLVFRS
jgi:hypothetical protein